MEYDILELEHDIFEGEVQERPPVESRAGVGVQGGLFYCEVTAHDDDGAVHLRTQDDEMVNIFMEDRLWKYAHKCHKCSDWGTKKLACDHLELTRLVDVLSAALHAL